MDAQWIKAAAAQVRTTIKQAIKKVDRIGNGESGNIRRPTLNDGPTARDRPEGKYPGADNK